MGDVRFKFAIAAVLAVAMFWSVSPNMGNPKNIESNGFPSHADLLVVLGGGWKFREIVGAQLFHQRLAERVLLTGVPKERDIRGFPANLPSYDYLLASGIPQAQIELDGTAKNTWEEVMYLRNRLNESQGKYALIVTDPPHLRRLDWVCRQVLIQSGIRYRLVGSRPDWWDAGPWWKNPESARFVLQEYLKLAYYQIRYP
ncbi:MAG: YdcF family protein [Methylococcaceae bacterium]|nr:YdcF family protein [Methylococcaceae bacterium]